MHELGFQECPKSFVFRGDPPKEKDFTVKHITELLGLKTSTNENGQQYQQEGPHKCVRACVCMCVCMCARVCGSRFCTCASMHSCTESAYVCLCVYVLAHGGCVCGRSGGWWEFVRTRQCAALSVPWSLKTSPLRLFVLRVWFNQALAVS